LFCVLIFFPWGRFDLLKDRSPPLHHLMSLATQEHCCIVMDPLVALFDFGCLLCYAQTLLFFIKFLVLPPLLSGWSKLPPFIVSPPGNHGFSTTHTLRIVSFTLSCPSPFPGAGPVLSFHFAFILNPFNRFYSTKGSTVLISFNVFLLTFSRVFL